MDKKSDTIECMEYDELVNGIEQARKRVQEAGKKAAAALFKRFFEEYPHVKALGWTQYTPYFNDGDACVFSVRDFYACTKDGVDFAEVSSLYDDDDNSVFRSSWSLSDSDKKTAAALDRMGRSASDEVFEAAFGDHVMVIATPEGFHINEYEHD